ncbi:MAG: hypothetical protein KF705_15390 [Phycisphaeraceae bacterium]|nr:hypothetical protein [Phycisphaeraceae bacterium]
MQNFAYAQAAEGNLSEEGVRVWVSALADERYWKITEPRPPFTAEREIEATSRALASIDPDDREWRGVEIAAIEAELRSVQERIRVATELPWIRMNRQTVIAEAGATRGEAERLARETEELIAFMRTSATDQIQRWMSEDVSTLTDIVAIRDGWTITRQAIALRLGEDAGGKPAQLRSALWNARRAILWDESPATGEIREAGWAKRLSDWNAASPATRPTSWDEGAWASAVQAKREAMARTLLRAIDGWDFTMRLDRWSNFDEVRSVEERAWESSESWASSCRSMAADFQRIESLIGLWYAPDERPGDGQETIAQLIGKWTGNDTVADARRAVAIVAANAERLGAVSTSDRARRVTLMSGREDDAWLRFAAWRSLAQSGADSMWPAGLDELREEIRSRSELLSQTVNISQETRRAQVRQEIESSGTRRWSNAILAGGLSDVEGIMDLREQMGVTAGASGLDPRAEINIALYEFVASIRDREEEEAKAMAGALVSRVRTLSSASALPVPLGRSLGALERTLGGGVTRKTLEQVLAENGPGRHRDFSVRSKRGGEDGFSAPDAITYANRQSVTFEFIRVNESESEPTYLSADELSIAQVWRCSPSSRAEPRRWAKHGPRSESRSVPVMSRSGSREAERSSHSQCGIPGGGPLITSVLPRRSRPVWIRPLHPPLRVLSSGSSPRQSRRSLARSGADCPQAQSGDSHSKESAASVPRPHVPRARTSETRRSPLSQRTSRNSGPGRQSGVLSTPIVAGTTPAISRGMMPSRAQLLRTTVRSGSSPRLILLAASSSGI